MKRIYILLIAVFSLGMGGLIMSMSILSER